MSDWFSNAIAFSGLVCSVFAGYTAFKVYRLNKEAIVLNKEAHKLNEETLKLNRDAQRNALREKVWQWQFDTVREMSSKINAFMDAYSHYELNCSYPDFNRAKENEKLEALISELDMTIEKYEFIPPKYLYDTLLVIVNGCDKQVTKLFKGETVLTCSELYQPVHDFAIAVNEFFGVEELSHENTRLINRYNG